MGSDSNDPSKPVRKQDPYVNRSDSSGDSYSPGGCMIAMFPMVGMAVLGAMALVKKVKR